MRLQAGFCLLLIIFFADFTQGKEASDDHVKTVDKRKEKILPIFQIVTFPNDPCDGGVKNGTCYTSEECSSRGGVNAGSCAEGFGVCCIFSYGCGSSSAENCTYFESPAGSATVNSGP